MLTTSYLGLELNNPLIVSSSGLTSTIQGIKRAADSGAGAVVLKSLFEEQLEAETDGMGVDEGHPEAYEYIRHSGMTLGPGKYLDLISKAQSEVNIPIIASLNCTRAQWWKEYGRQLENSGAQALEINLSHMPSSLTQSGEDIESELVQTVERIRNICNLPLAIKIGPYFTSLPQFGINLRKAGADALVLFNRFYQFDINLAKAEPRAKISLSHPDDFHIPLRWISILHDRIGLDLSASTGVHDAESALKLVAAGAQTVQICSVIYRNNFEKIESMLGDIKSGLSQLGLDSLDKLRGRNSQKNSPTPESFERLQYIKLLTGVM